MSVSALCLACLLAWTPAAAKTLYGLGLVANQPAKIGLTRLDALTGRTTATGPKHTELFGESDLVAIAHDTFYYLGDTVKGTTLVALNLTTGERVCDLVVDVAEIEMVGIGQSLDYDSSTDSLVLSGVTLPTTAGTHTIYRGPAKGCGHFKKVGTFGVATYAPMLHSAALDPRGQRLFVNLAPTKSTQAIGVIDLAAGGNMTVIGEGAHFGDRLLSLHFSPGATPAQARVFGLYLDQTRTPPLTLHALHPSGTEAWDTPKPLLATPSYWNALGGNEGVVSLYDDEEGSLYFLAGRTNHSTGQSVFELARVDVESAAVLSNPPIGAVGLCGAFGGECLEALAQA